MKRLVLPVAVISMALALGAGCSKTDTTSTTNTTQAQSSSGDAKSSTTKAGDVSVPGNVSIPGGGNLDQTMADAQKCMDMAAAYGGLYASIMGGSDDDNAQVQQML